MVFIAQFSLRFIEYLHKKNIPDNLLLKIPA